MSNFNRALDPQRLSANGTGFARDSRAQIRPFVGIDVATDLNIAQVKAIFIGAGGHVPSPMQSLVSDNCEFRDIDCPEAAWFGSERRNNLLFVRGAKVLCAD